MVNEHTASAGEMVAAFASESKLATIVGTETAGRQGIGTSASCSPLMFQGAANPFGCGDRQ